MVQTEPENEDSPACHNLLSGVETERNLTKARSEVHVSGKEKDYSGSAVSERVFISHSWAMRNISLRHPFRPFESSVLNLRT